MRRGRELMEYKLRKNEHGDVIVCDDCDSQVETHIFSGERYLCEFCSNSVGRSYDVVTKSILAQMFNQLKKELKK
jgi:hypothetical protein